MPQKRGNDCMRVADFFCGGGGFSEGFRQAGFDIVFAVDKWEPAVKTYKGNKPGVNVRQDDVIRISQLPDDEFEKLDGLKQYLESTGIPCQELYGETPVEREGLDDDEFVLTREKIVKAFQHPDCPFKVIIANPFAVAESISLHKACHNAIYIERSFNAAHFVQSKDRIHRYGLEPNTITNYYYVLSRDTVDETIDTRLAEKERRMTEIMESMPIPLFNNVSEDLGDEDIKALIRDYVRRTKKP